MSNCLEKNYKLFLWITNIRKIYTILFRNNYKIFLWIAYIREIYIKLYSEKTYFTNNFYGGTGAAASSEAGTVWNDSSLCGPKYEFILLEI
jgi:hypothetical protein